MRRILSFFFALILMTGIATLASAAELPVYLASGGIVKAPLSSVYHVMYAYTSHVTAVLTFSGNKAKCVGTVSPSGTYDASLTVTLYKKNGSKWTSIASWSGSAKGGRTASAGGSATVTSGTYKVTTRGKIGTGLEYPTSSVTKTK
jgi:hypothetical protein